VALILPVLIAVVISSAFAISRPHKYQSTMSLWFDSEASQASTVLNPGNGPTPAATGITVLQEFLATDAFRQDVVLHSPLGAEFSKPGDTAQLEAFAGSLTKAFTETASGPQVVEVTMTAANPAYMKGMLNAVNLRLSAEITNLLNNRSNQSSAYWTPVVNQARQTLTSDDAAVQTYVRNHQKENLAADNTYSQLTQAAAAAATALTNDSNGLEQSELGDQPQLASQSFHVIDPPSPPVALSSKKHDILIGVAGLLAGIVISLIALSALTGLDKTARSEEDIDSVLDVDVVASIGQLRDRRSLTFGRERSS
jgi:uncharacterized protein involved in exopolysaccharide biosynthesis